MKILFLFFNTKSELTEENEMKIAKIILITLISSLLLLTIGGIVGYSYLKKDLPDAITLKKVELHQPMKVFTQDGELIGEIGEENRIYLTIDQIPQPLIDAIIATEDSRFYEHHGFDVKGIARAVVSLVKGGHRQGASTITQQLAKNFFLTPERTITRKLKELILAIEIEKVMTKEEILELYLNKIFLGYRSYGVGRAAYTYFGKDINELSLGEIAILAGLPKAPSTINPIHSPKRAQERRDIVLWRMLQEGKISQEQYDEARNEPIISKYHGINLDFNAGYLTEMIRREMVERFGEKEVYTQGYQVYATVVSDKQMAAQKALRKALLTYDKKHGWRGGNPLWKANKKAWDNEQIIEYLDNLPKAKPLLAGAVVRVFDSRAQVLLENGETVDLYLPSMKWAARYINESRKGNNPRRVSDVLKVGLQIWVEKHYNKNQEPYYTLSQIPDANSGFVSLNSETGAIEAIVGGFSFSQSKFNRATQSQVQVGSTIKPFIYAAAINKGMSLATVLNDAPITIYRNGQKPWNPKNSPNIYDGPTRMKIGLAKSKNTMMVRTVRLSGVQYVADYLKRFGFDESRYDATESLALGTASFTPLEIARGYAVFNNGGFLVKPYIIDRILDTNGNEIYKANPSIACDSCKNSNNIYAEPELLNFVQNKILEEDDSAVQSTGDDEEDLSEEKEITQIKQDPSLMVDDFNLDSSIKYAPRVISPEVAFLMRHALHQSAYGEPGQEWLGTSWRVGRTFVNRSDVGGKTGTTNRSRSAWYTGFGGNIVSTIYVGKDNNKPLGRGEAGGSLALPAWIDYMKVALKDQKINNKKRPANIISVKIDAKYGLLGDDIDEYFIKGTEPTKKHIEERGYIIEQKDDVTGEVTEEELF